jgi:hypothetical protein
MRWYAGIGVSISFVVPGGCIGLDPLKQFARVIHGNHPVQGRIAMGSPAPPACLLEYQSLGAIALVGHLWE